MVPPTRVENATSQASVFQAVHIAIVKRDALLAMRIRAEHLTTPSQQITDQPTNFEGQRLRPHMYRRDKQR